MPFHLCVFFLMSAIMGGLWKCQIRKRLRLLKKLKKKKNAVRLIGRIYSIAISCEIKIACLRGIDSSVIRKEIKGLFLYFDVIFESWQMKDKNKSNEKLKRNKLKIFCPFPYFYYFIQNVHYRKPLIYKFLQMSVSLPPSSSNQQ